MRLPELAYRFRAKLRPAPGSRLTGPGGQSFLLIGRTDRGGQVLVCALCWGFDEPYFFFRYGRGREICLLLEDARPMEPHDNLPLSRRWELERFFRRRRAPSDPTNWEQALAAWNACNTRQVSEQLHRPFYVNLLQRGDWATAFTRRGKFALRIGRDDCEARPPFPLCPAGRHGSGNQPDGVRLDLPGGRPALPGGTFRAGRSPGRPGPQFLSGHGISGPVGPVERPE